MWMMGCNDGTGDAQESFNGRKLRPFMPITAAAAASAARSHGTDHFLALNHHFVMDEQNKREFSGAQQVVVSSRWNPTPEQLQTLEELYRRGARTPSAEQIQHITAQLRRYGKIEGKNVFYWFQNHKARERQKRRRQLDQEHQNVNQIPNIERKKQSSAGENGTAFEVEQTNCNKLASPKKSTTTIAQKSMPRRGAEGNKADGWVHFNEQTELAREEERRNPSIWKMLHLSSSSASPNNLFNSSSVTVDTNTLNHHHFPSLQDQYGGAAGGGGGSRVEEHTKTLQLFPVRSGCRRPCEEEEEDQSFVSPDYQFFEFLPLKK